MNTYLDWADFKLNITNKAALRFTERDEFYTLNYGDFSSSVLKSDPAGSDQTDFETNFKALCNKTISFETSPFASKNIGTKSLFTRTHGVEHSLSTGANVLDFEITYALCKVNGVEVIGGELSDYADFKIVHPTYGVVGQFAYNNYIAKDFYARTSNYDSELVAGLIMRIDYTSASAKSIYVNYLLHEVV